LLFDLIPPSADGSATTAGTGGGSGTVGSSTSSTTPCSTASLPWLLFELDDGEATRLYAMRSDGSSGHRVPLVHDSQLYASISADGTKLTYVVFEPESDGGYDGTLYLEDLTTRTAAALLSSGEPPLYSSISGDDETIAYTQGQGIYVMGADGQSSRLVIEAPPSSTFGDGHPLFVGSTNTILYGAYHAFASIETDGSNDVTLVTEGSIAAGFFPNPALSPDLASVAAAVQCEEDEEAWVRVYPYASLPASCESGAKIAKTSGYSSAPNEAADPSWGPTNLIAYADAKDVFVVSAAGGAPRNMTAALTSRRGSAFDPIWADGCAPVP